jgi:hypothetical protein
MDNPNTLKQLGSGLIRTILEEFRINNGFNHLSLQHNLSNRYRIVLWIDEITRGNPLKWIIQTH